jgi:hypothetical protein
MEKNNRKDINRKFNKNIPFSKYMINKIIKQEWKKLKKLKM